MRQVWQDQLADSIQAIIETEAKRLVETQVHAEAVIIARLDHDIEERLDKVEETVVNHLTENIKEQITELISEKVDYLDFSTEVEAAVEREFDSGSVEGRIDRLVKDAVGQFDFDKKAEEAVSEAVEDNIAYGRLKEVLDTVDLAVAEVEKIQAGLGCKIDEYLAHGVEWDALLGKLLASTAIRRNLQLLITEEVDNALLEQMSFRPTKKRSWWRRLLRWLAGDE